MPQNAKKKPNFGRLKSKFHKVHIKDSALLELEEERKRLENQGVKQDIDMRRMFF